MYKIICTSLKLFSSRMRGKAGLSGITASVVPSFVGNVGCATVKMPFYQFNSFTGSLKPSTNFQPFFPIKTERVMIYDTVKTKPAVVTSTAGYCTNKPRTLDPKMWAKYKHFQANLDKPVYLMGGKKDKILFGFTVAYVGLCTMQSFYFLIKEGYLGS
ncbi:uncharacterized protein LOC116841748 isoform X2 [Odontomachus brunneus]|uniref:uncharacterized protein LOC116841748 isoform X2 n=1 Tax=Odontomachus brunneus TaxID=486640 RepID=UPI0013F20138|nr:uncharacterized protein LOC116841748 isoform X2 [Odontomachus brunneus]